MITVISNLPILKFLVSWTCQALPFKFGKISFRKKINDKSPSKMPIQIRAPAKKRVTTISLNETTKIK